MKAFNTSHSHLHVSEPNSKLLEKNCNPGVAGSIPRSSSLSDETLNRGPVSMT